MSTIWKFGLPTRRPTIDMPVSAKPISVGEQGGGLWVWAVCSGDVLEATEPRPFTIVGTGHPMPDGLGPFLGTVFVGHLVWHIYEGGRHGS